MLNITGTIMAYPGLVLAADQRVKYVENKNQWEDFIRYQADFRGGRLYLENDRFTYLFYHPGDIQAMHPHEGQQLDRIRLHAVRVKAVKGNLHALVTSDGP